MGGDHQTALPAMTAVIAWAQPSDFAVSHRRTHGLKRGVRQVFGCGLHARQGRACQASPRTLRPVSQRNLEGAQGSLKAGTEEPRDLLAEGPPEVMPVQQQGCLHVTQTP